MKTRLVSYRGAKIDLAFPVQGPRVTIGRENDNMIQLPHEKVSKHHGVILQTKEGWVIEDLQSTNGIFVNGQRTEHAKLASIAESVGERYLQSAGNALFSAQNGPKSHADMR